LRKQRLGSKKKVAIRVRTKKKVEWPASRTWVQGGSVRRKSTVSATSQKIHIRRGEPKWPIRSRDFLGPNRYLHLNVKTQTEGVMEFFLFLVAEWMALRVVSHESKQTAASGREHFKRSVLGTTREVTAQRRPQVSGEGWKKASKRAAGDCGKKIGAPGKAKRTGQERCPTLPKGKRGKNRSLYRPVAVVQSLGPKRANKLSQTCHERWEI